MQTNKFTLFGGEFATLAQEQAYRASRFSENRRHAAVIMLAWGVVNALFFLSDFRHLGDAHYFVALIARTVVVGGSLLGAATALKVDDVNRLHLLFGVWQGGNALAAAALATSGGHAAMISVYLLPALLYLTSPTSFRATVIAGAACGVMTLSGYVWTVGLNRDLPEQGLMLVLLNAGLAAAVARDNRLSRKEWLATEAERQANAELAASRAMIERMFDAAPVPLLVSAADGGRILRHNAAARASFGGDPAALGVTSVRHIYADAEQRAEMMRELTQNGKIHGHEARITLPDGANRDVLVSATMLDYDGVPAVMSGAIDITARKMLESHLAQLATSDSLTGLANRSRFFSAARRELHQARRDGRPICVLLADIDHFKQINDHYGHDVGDVALTAFAETMRDSLRPTDVCARLGGEEFSALLPGAHLGEALRVAERLREAIERLTTPAGQATLRLTVSIGVASVWRDEDTIESALSRADVAMYRAKRAGRNCVMAQEEKTANDARPAVAQGALA